MLSAKKERDKAFSYTHVTRKVYQAVQERKRSPRKGNLTMRKTAMTKTVINMVQRPSQIKCLIGKKKNPVKSSSYIPQN